MRTKDGDIKTATGRKPRLRIVDNIPGARGVARLAEAMVVIPLVKRSLPEARLPFQHASVRRGHRRSDGRWRAAQAPLGRHRRR